MKKIASILILGVVMVACNQEEANKDLAEKKALLEKYNSQVDSIKSLISDLQDEIKELDTTQSDNLKQVAVKKLLADTFTHFIELRGVVSSKSTAVISPEMNGEIIQVSTSAGDRISEGQVIAVLNSDVIRKQVEELNTALELAETAYKKQKNLWDQQIGSEMQFLQAKNQYESLQKKLESAETQLGKTVVKSPISGTVDEVFQNKGETAFAGNPIARVVNLSDVDVVVDVPEKYLPSVKKGGLVKIFFPTIEIEKEVKITSVGQFINPNNRTFKVNLRMKNDDGLLRPNLLANVFIKDYEKAGVVSVPTKYILQSQQGDFVYVARSNGNTATIERIIIKTGKSYKGMTEVLSGLNAGDKLVTAGFNIVVNGQEVQAVPER